MWKMINAENAIEAMAVTVRFAEPVSSVLLKRVIRDLERTTTAAGLINRQAVQGFQVDIQGPAGTAIRQIPMSGMIFQRTSLTRVEGTVIQQLAQQVDIQPTHIVISTWRYRRWSVERDAIIELLKGAFDTIAEAVALSAFRIEFLDRFYFEGDPGSSVLGDLLNRDSGFIAPHVFEAPNLWHSHTGRFEDVSATSRKLLQINADAQELASPPSLVGRHSVSVTTAAELQFTPPGLEFAGDDAMTFLSDTLNDLHASVIALFRQAIDSRFQEKHGLAK
jgi:hypothetical protein